MHPFLFIVKGRARYNVFLVSSLSEELSNSAVLQAYTPEMPLRLKDTVETYSCSQENAHLDHLNSIFAALPPSFTSMLSNCSDVKQGRCYI